MQKGQSEHGTWLLPGAIDGLKRRHNLNACECKRSKERFERDGDLRERERRGGGGRERQRDRGGGGRERQRHRSERGRDRETDLREGEIERQI